MAGTQGAEAGEPFRGSFVGRERDLAEIERAILSGSRLVTLLGPGGIGKTRLLHRAIARARSLGKNAICDLSSARTAADVVALVAAEAAGVALGASSTTEAASARVGRALARRRLAVLGLDNVEQVASSAVPIVADWLLAAPDTVVIVTSRVRLGAPGEVVIRVGPLAREEATQLFADRVAAVRGPLTDDERAAAERIVLLLEGLPLALELAAARLCVLGPEELLERLSRPLAILASGARDDSDRHASIARVLDGSWQMLGESDREALGETGVFVGGFTIRAAEAVLTAGDASLFALQRLVDSSLIRATPSASGRVRHVPYEVVREYAIERLAERGSLDATRLRHARHFAVWGDDQLEAISASRRADEALRELVAEEANLVAAATLVRAIPAQIATRLRLLVALEPVRTLRGHLDAWAEDLDDALAVAASATPSCEPRLVARARLALARALHELGRPEAARKAYAVAVDVARAAADARAHGLATIGLGRLLAGLGEWKNACELFESVRAMPGVGDAVAKLARACHEFYGTEIGAATDPAGATAAYVDVCRRGADPRELVFWVVQLGRVESEITRQRESAEAHLDEALAIAREIGDRRGEGFALLGLGVHAVGYGRPADAVDILDEAGRALHDAGTKRYEGWAHGFRAVAHAYRVGEEGDALAAFELALAQLAEVGDAPRAAHLHAFRAAVHARRGDADAVALDLKSAREAAPPESRYHAWTIELSSGQLEVARAVKASSTHDAAILLARARERLTRATWPRGGTYTAREWPWGSEFFEPRLAAELLERAVDAASEPSGALAVARDGSSLRLPGGARIVVAGKTKLMRLIVVLVEARISRPGEPVNAAILFEAAWPGERVPRTAAMNRLHVALDQLRKVGLRDVLVRGGGGWHIDSDVPCAWSLTSGN